MWTSLMRIESMDLDPVLLFECDDAKSIGTVAC
jgi:hypothetical protein